VLEAVIKEEQLQALPLYFFGASSGGGIVLRLAQIMPQAQVCAAWQLACKELVGARMHAAVHGVHVLHGWGRRTKP
jgi:alpha-beta hydrolase superfamily lysophospholipase